MYWHDIMIDSRYFMHFSRCVKSAFALILSFVLIGCQDFRLVGDGHSGPALLQIGGNDQNSSGLLGDSGSFAPKSTERIRGDAAAVVYREHVDQRGVHTDRDAVYNPHDMAERQRLKSRVAAVLADVGGSSALTADQARELEAALLPYARFMRLALAANDGGVVIPPHGRVILTERGYCLDSNFAGPGMGEQFRLVPATDLVPVEFLDIYQGLVRHPGDDTQNLLWFLRHVAQGRVSHPLQISPEWQAKLEAAYPGAVRTILAYDAYHHPGPGLLQILDPQLDQLTTQLASLNSQTQQISNNLLTLLLARATPPPVAEQGPGYALLENGVAARLDGTGALSLKIDVVNNTGSPAVFFPADWVAEAPRQVQRVALADGQIPAVVIPAGYRPPVIGAGDIASMLLDLSPFGNLKAALQLLTGVDLVTQKPVDRALQILFMLPLVGQDMRMAEAFGRVEADAVEMAARDENYSGFLGHNGFELKNAPYQPVRNSSAEIGGRFYTSHALDQMQNRGVMPSVVEHAIETGTQFASSRPGTTGFYDAENKIMVVVDSGTGRVVTVIRGAPK